MFFGGTEPLEVRPGSEQRGSFLGPRPLTKTYSKSLAKIATYWGRGAQ